MSWAAMKKHPVLEGLKKASIKRVGVSIKMPTDVDAAIKAIAQQTGAPYSAVLVEMVRLGLEKVK